MKILEILEKLGATEEQKNATLTNLNRMDFASKSKLKVSLLKELDKLKN